MKNFKRVLALVTIVTIVAMSSMISTFALGTMSATPSAEIVEGGDTVSIAIEMSSLIDAKGTTASIKFDNTAFALPAGSNTKYDFGDGFDSIYYPNYMNESFIERANKVFTKASGFLDVPLSVFTTVSYNATEDEVMVILVDTAQGRVISSNHETKVTGPYNVGYFDFVANADIAPGTYDFEVKLDVSTANGVQSFTETVTVEVESDEPTYKDVDYKNAVAANKANIKAEGVEYENVAVFKASFDLADLAEKKATEYGIALNNNKKSFAFNGNGTVDYVLAFYGVTAEEADGISVDTYYTVLEEVK